MISWRKLVRMAAACGAMLSAAWGWAATDKPNRPNFVWLVSEDNSKHFAKLFDQHGTEMPQVEKLAGNGVVFTHAFSNCPVCSTARSTLATGCYAPRIGTQFHRKLRAVPLPEGLRPFHVYLRKAGYFCPDPGKTDYNFITDNKRGWAGRWSDRQQRRPFFYMRSFGISHEGQLHRRSIATAEVPQSDTVFIPPIHPDTKTFRNSYATYLMRVRRADEQIGHVIKELEEAGLIEDTFIFYFGDHGGVLPGSKGYVRDTGLHVPLVVRIPKNFEHLVGLKRGTRSDAFVSFVDFGPTLLHLAGLDVPEGMDGKPFMGPNVTRAQLDKRDETFGMADRFDEKYDLVRTLRKGRFKYMRSYQPFNFDGLQNNYRYRMPAYKQWRELYRAGRLSEVQSAFFEPRPAETLYDMEADPYETTNLAGDPAYAQTLAALRARLTEWVKGMPDLSFYPESLLIKKAFDNPTAFGRNHKAEIARMVDIADLQLEPFAEAKAGIEKALASSSVWDQYWGLIVCSAHGKAAAGFAQRAKALTGKDVEPLVRVRAAEFLGLIGAADPRPTLTDVLATTDDPVEALLTLNTVVLLRDGKPGYEFTLAEDGVKALNQMVKWRLAYLAPKKN